jgi:hypothetical protein
MAIDVAWVSAMLCMNLKVRIVIINNLRKGRFKGRFAGLIVLE